MQTWLGLTRRTQEKLDLVIYGHLWMQVLKSKCLNKLDYAMFHFTFLVLEKMYAAHGSSLVLCILCRCMPFSGDAWMWDMNCLSKMTSN
jgi:hypothetical protein